MALHSWSLGIAGRTRGRAGALPVREAEVLVLGAGLAGLAAALEARRAGREVLLAAPHPPGRSGNSLLAACNLSGVFAPDDAEESFARDTLAGGAGIGDPALVRALARGSRQLVPFLEALGVPLQGRPGALRFRSNPGHSVPRTIATRREGIPWTVGGLSLTRPVAAAAAAEGVRFALGAAEELLVRDGRVHGARIAGPGGPFAVLAGAVVLATGGAGRLYARSDNAADVTGDGLALAYRAGAELRDLELVQFHPTVAVWPVRGVIPTTLFAEGAVLRNRLGERFLAHHAPGGEATVTRDAMSRAILREVAEGRGEGGPGGEGVWLDLSAVAPEVLRAYPEVWDALVRRGLDPRRQPIRVSPAAHFCMGGVTVDPAGAATLSGLFAAGEVTGGVHGANRLGGNALTEALVFGRAAGRSAAAWAGTVPRAGFDPDAFPDPVRGTRPTAAKAILAAVRALLWETAGIDRSGEELAEGLARWHELAASIPGGGWEDAPCLVVSRLLLEAAQRREESRGAHFRSEFPAQDPTWRGSLRVRRGGEAGGRGPEIRFTAADGGTGA